MPHIGDIERAYKIGYKGRAGFIWQDCKDCGKERWVSLQNISPRCQACATKTPERKAQYAIQHEKRPGWRRRRLSTDGYVDILLKQGSFFFDMANKQHYVREHRIVMAQHLGRCLQPFEFVHHKNGIKDDNRIENLELTTMFNHITDHNKGYGDGYRKGLEDGRLRQIQELKKEIERLKR